MEYIRCAARRWHSRHRLHATDFTPPVYNVWKQQEKTTGLSHFGNSEVRWVDNLLYLYTQPFDVVIDPFAGSGSTADLCRKSASAAAWSRHSRSPPVA